MPDAWNPNSPAVVGLEWQPVHETQFAASAVAKSVVQSLDQTVVENIDTIRVYVPSANTPTHAGVVVEVFDGTTTEITLPITQTIFRPNQTTGGTNVPGTSGWHDQAGLIVNVHNSINDQDDATFIQAECRTDGGVLGWLTNLYTGRFDVGVGNLTGERILGVDVMTRGFKFAPAAVDLLFVGAPGGGGTWSEFKRMSGTVIRERIAPSLLHPNTFRPWLISEVETFDTTGEFQLRGFAHTFGSFISVHEVELHVYHVPETRIALGGVTATFTAPQWRAISNVVTPLGATWAKDGAGVHTYVVRRIAAPLIAATGGGYQQTTPPKTFTVRTLSDGEPPDKQGYDVQTESDFGTVLGTEGPNDTLFPLIQRTTLPSTSVDSQPYVNIEAAPVYVDSLSVATFARQEFSNHITATYALVRAVIRRVGTPNALAVTVRDTATHTPLNGIGFVVSDYDGMNDPQIPIYDELPDVGDGWRYVELFIWDLSALPALVPGGTPLVAGTQYEMQFDEFTLGGPSDGPTSRWEIATLDTLNEGNVATFGGTTDVAEVDGVRDARYTLEAQLAIVPDAPANFSVVTDSQELSGSCETCNVEGIDYGLLTWDATSLVAAFGSYEIQRSDDSQVTWDTIATVTDESIEEFSDYEGRRVEEVCYRIRVITSAEIPSLWTDPSCTTYLANNCEFIFTSNEAPWLNLAYEPAPERNYEFIDAEETVFQAIYGRDYQLAFQPTEQRGVRLRVPVRIACIETVGRGGVAQFDALRALATAVIPYVTVLDMYGNRFYAHLDVPTGTHREPFADYVAEIVITEIQGVPTPVVLPDLLS